MPIGNLTSQIFANIYLNELDRCVAYQQKPSWCVRYGDDFLVCEPDLAKLRQIRENTIIFAWQALGLTISPKSDILVKARQGLKFLDVEIFPHGRRLKKRNVNRISERLTLANVSSYHGLVCKHEPKGLKEFNWRVIEEINNA